MEIRALRMRSMDSNADEDVSYVVDAGMYFLAYIITFILLIAVLDALNKAQSHDSLVSDGVSLFNWCIPTKIIFDEKYSKKEL